MRRVVSFLVAAVMVASTVDALPLTCPAGAAVGSTHSCCAGEAARTGPPTCCTIVQGTNQRGPAEATVVAPAPPVLTVRATPAPRVISGRWVRRSIAVPPADSAPLYLQQHTLLI